MNNLFKIEGTTLVGVTDEGEKMSKLIIPKCVTEIGESAFHACKSLTSVIIPDSVTYIGNNAFDGCISLKHITISNNITYFRIRIATSSQIERF